MKYTIVNQIQASDVNLKNQLVAPKDSKLVNILSSSMLQNQHHFLKEHNHVLEGAQKVGTYILESYFNHLPTYGNTYVGKHRGRNSSVKMFTNPKILISNPMYDHSANGVNITVFYYYNDNPRVENYVKMHYLCENHLKVISNQLSMVFKKSAHLHLIRVHYPYMNSRILAQYLCGKTDKTKFVQLCDALVSKSSLKVALYGKSGSDKENFILPSYMDSIRLELSGRLASERVVPRLTKQVYRMDSPNTNTGIYLQQAGLSSDTIQNKVVDYGKYTSKNHLGAYTLKVWITSLVTIHK